MITQPGRASKPGKKGRVASWGQWGYNTRMTRRQPTRLRPAAGSLRSAALLVALLCGAPAAVSAGARPAEPPAARRPVCIRGTCFDAEVAVTAAERAQGLMFRETLGSGRGMLFVFPEAGRHSFWMKNTRIELDIIFIGADLRVVSIARRAQPCRREPCEVYSPAGDVAYALEIAGGRAADYGFAAGDPVEFREAAAGR